MARDGHRCAYCGVTAKDRELEVDHIQPLSKGGTNADSNLITACWWCNSGKSDTDVPVPA